MSSATAVIRMLPLMIGCQKDSVFIRLMPLSIEAIIERPQKRPPNRAPPAHKGSAPDDRGRDGVQFHHAPRV